MRIFGVSKSGSIIAHVYENECFWAVEYPSPQCAAVVRRASRRPGSSLLLQAEF